MVSCAWDGHKYSWRCYEKQCSKMKYNIEQKLFIYDTFVQRSSRRKCSREFRRKFSDSAIPCKVTIYNIITKLRSVGSVLDKIKSPRRHALTGGTLGGIDTRSETVRIRCYVFWLFSVGWQNVQHIGTMVLTLWPYKTTGVKSVLPKTARQKFCTLGDLNSWYLMDIFIHKECLILTKRGAL
jgi:hypothetical protein